MFRISSWGTLRLPETTWASSQPCKSEVMSEALMELTCSPQIKPHGAVYGQTSRSLPLARAVVEVAKIFSSPNEEVSFVGIAGSAHQTAAEEMSIKFIPGTSSH